MLADVAAACVGPNLLVAVVGGFVRLCVEDEEQGAIARGREGWSKSAGCHMHRSLTVTSQGSGGSR